MPSLLQDWLKNHTEYEAAGRKLAVVAGPGGNAGVLTSGLLAAMVKTGTKFPTAQYIGISVGAYNWLYYFAENYEACTVYSRFYCNKRFINPWRIFSKRPVLNLDYILNEVSEHGIPIDYTCAEKSPYKASALTTDDHGNLHLLPLTGVPKSVIKETLRATATMPLLGRTHNLHHAAHWDGWLVEPKLLPYLQRQGITDVIWILNRSLAQDNAWHTRLLWQHIVRKFNNHNTTLAAQIQERRTIGNFLAHPPKGLNLEVIAPPFNLRANCKNPAKIFQALGHSYRWMSNYLGHPNLPYPQEWAPYTKHMPE